MNEKCNGCKHTLFIEPGNYCYMFKDAPNNLPCAQHDKFAGQRERMGSLIRRHPEILAMMIREIGRI